MSATLLARTTLLYFTGINGYSAALFAYDKHQATVGNRRIPERRLCNTAMYGGWLGGLLAMQLFRHKTRKKSFQRKYVESVGRNVTMVGMPMVAVVALVPPVRAAFAREIGRVFSMGGGAGKSPYGKWGGGRKPPRMRR